MAQKKQPTWSDIKRKLADIDRPGLVGLVQDLFHASADNRAFLASRFLADEDDGAALEEFRQRVIDPFFPKRGLGNLNLRDARKAISQYRQARGDARGLIELMLTYVEAGTRFTNTYGDIHEAFYNSLSSMLADLVKLLQTTEGLAEYPHFAPRLSQLAQDAGDIGWGYGDEVVDEIEKCRGICRAAAGELSGVLKRYGRHNSETTT